MLIVIKIILYNYPFTKVERCFLVRNDFNVGVFVIQSNKRKLGHHPAPILYIEYPSRALESVVVIVQDRGY